MKIQEHAARVIVIFFKEPLKFVLASLIAMVVSACSLGILAPVMWLGMGEMFKKMRAGAEATYSDLFIHLDKAVMLAVLGFIVVVCVSIGSILIIPGIIIGALFMYSLYYMAYKGTGLMDSLKYSSLTVNKTNLMTNIVITLAVWLIMSTGFSIFIGAFITYPLCAGFMAFMFEEVKETNDLV